MKYTEITYKYNGTNHAKVIRESDYTKFYGTEATKYYLNGIMETIKSLVRSKAVIISINDNHIQNPV